MEFWIARNTVGRYKDYNAFFTKEPCKDKKGNYFLQDGFVTDTQMNILNLAPGECKKFKLVEVDD